MHSPHQGRRWVVVVFITLLGTAACGEAQSGMQGILELPRLDGQHGARRPAA